MSSFKPMIMLDCRQRCWRLMVDAKFTGRGYPDEEQAKAKIGPRLEKALAAWAQQEAEEQRRKGGHHAG